MLHVAWLIPACPLLGFALLILFGRRLGDPGAGWLATAMSGASFVFVAIAFVGLLGRTVANRTFIQILYNWVPVGGFKIDAALQIDPLSLTMALFVTGVGTLIHLFAIGYMRGDPRYPRFFVYFNLFLFSMLMLVLANNFLLMFLGWEGVGTCSYLLVSFWFERERAASAGKKAFVTNRVGDWGFMMGMFLIFSHFGSLDVHRRCSPRRRWGPMSVRRRPPGSVSPCSSGHAASRPSCPSTCGCPDAMEGPTCR